MRCTEYSSVFGLSSLRALNSGNLDLQSEGNASTQVECYFYGCVVLHFVNIL
jgi:hypothetical protein